MKVFRLVLLGVAACLMAAVGWRFTVETGRSARTVAPTSAPPGAGPFDRALIEARLRNAPEFAPFYAALQRDFPRPYGKFVDSLVARMRQANTLPASDSLIWDAQRELQQSQGVLAAHAGNLELQDYFDARVAVLDALASVDVRECADFLYGITDASFREFTEHHRPVVAALALRQLAAIAAGRDEHIERAAPTPADFDQLSAGLAGRSFTPEEIAVVLDGKTVDPPLSDARLCDMGRIYLDVLRSLPDDARQRIYGLAAELLARS